ncbi:MAG: hypothetical protein KDD11_20690, partial [Acidobacteria bacterium]|nr:hypothetical protein [Acidobacteriota bacterium]
GQWVDGVWEGAGAGARVVQNVFRWYQPEAARYSHPDPAGLKGGTNLFAYAGSRPVTLIDPTGLAYFAKRPLKNWPWLGPASCNPGFSDDLKNTEISHEQLFFEDGKSPSNVGFFGDGSLKEEPDPNGYRCRSQRYDDCIMRKAAANVGTPRPYCLLGKPGRQKYNCQDWADDVRREYRRLQKDPGVKADCCNGTRQ